MKQSTIFLLSLTIAVQIFSCAKQASVPKENQQSAQSTSSQEANIAAQPLNADSLVRVLLQVSSIDYQSSNQDPNYSTASKHEYSDFINFDINDLSAKLSDGNFNEINKISGKLNKSTAFYVGMGCVSDSLYSYDFDNLLVISHDIITYISITPSATANLLKASQNWTTDSLLVHFGEPLEKSSGIWKYLCRDIAEEMHGDGSKEYSPLVQFLLEENGIKKVLIIIPSSC